jgi:hypothetical protein
MYYLIKAVVKFQKVLYIITVNNSATNRVSKSSVKYNNRQYICSMYFTYMHHTDNAVHTKEEFFEN